MKRISLVILLCIILSFGTGVLVKANENYVTPRYANLSYCHQSFYIEDDIAIAQIITQGIPNITTKITVNVTIEKKGLLGLWWKEEANWQSSTTDTSKNFEFSKEVKGGTYRCNFEVIIEGTGGSTDIITNQITATN